MIKLVSLALLNSLLFVQGGATVDPYTTYPYAGV
jgi:hypothetical protein